VPAEYGRGPFLASAKATESGGKILPNPLRFWLVGVRDDDGNDHEPGVAIDADPVRAPGSGFSVSFAPRLISVGRRSVSNPWG
jgi:hypothetical protein